MMKIRSIAYIALFFGAAILTSCGGDDDETVVIPPPTGGGDDGIFITGTASSETPSADVEMTEANIDAFGSQPPFAERPGLFEAYIYLEAGDFNFTEIEGEEETTWGGTVADEDLGTGKLWVGNLTEDGAAVEITDAGLYHVTLDMTSSTFYLSRILKYGLIGNAQGSWSSGSELALQPGASAASVVFKGTGIELRQDEFKFRYNENWNVDRSAATPPVDGLNFLTNFGTDVNMGDENGSFEPGGYNFVFAGEEGLYDVTLTFTPGAGYNVEADYVKTGDVQPITFNPDSNMWAVIGSATPNGWTDGPDDHDFNYIGEDGGTYTWMRTMSLLPDSAFKLRTNDSWDNNLGVGGLTIDGSASSLFGGSDNIEVNASAKQYYLLTLKTSDEGENYTLTIDSLSWGMIGAATDSGWDASVEMTYDGADAFVLTTNLTDDEFKFRANNDWTYNFGGSSLTNLEFNSGTNLQTGTSGVKTVTLTAIRGGDSYEADIQ